MFELQQTSHNTPVTSFIFLFYNNEDVINSLFNHLEFKIPEKFVI